MNIIQDNQDHFTINMCSERKTLHRIRLTIMNLEYVKTLRKVIRNEAHRTSFTYSLRI